MRRQSVDVTVPASAPPDMIYRLLRDGATWPTWSPLGSFELESPGETEPEGLGAIRVFRTGRHTSRERIVELVPDRRLGYELVSGLAIRGYRADVDLEPAGAGTTIHWHSSFVAKVPGTGWLYRRTLSRFIRRCAAGLAERAASSTTRITER
jgi:hypothetical protein